MKFSIPVLLIALTFPLLAADAPRYPNELESYKFFAAAKWHTLTPGVSTLADVRKTLGDPEVAGDIAEYSKPYPGDDKAIQPYFRYDVDADWQLIIYFGRSDLSAPEKLRAAIPDRLYQIALVPTKPLSFKNVVFPATFKKKVTVAADARWDEFSDGTGLSYSVYTSNSRFGNLNRITYGLSDEAIQKILESEKNK